MNAKRGVLVLLGTAAVLVAARAAVHAQSADSLQTGPSWQAAPPEAVKVQAMTWLEEHKPSPEIRGKASEIWAAKPQNPSSVEVLNRLVKTFALADENVRRLMEFCSKPRGNAMPPAQPWLADPKAPALVTKNVRLWYARWLVHESLYDEALEVLDGVLPADVVDPASLLFYQGVANHRLSNKDPGVEALEQLLEGADLGPKRYATLARLMEADLKNLKEDSLDHIARRMEDIGRRLDLGRGGKKVRKIEDGVIASLDKLIKEIEDQQQQQSSSGASGNNIRSTSPAQDSRIMGGKGKGDVDRKRVGSESGWGNLPPKEREEALQQIGRDFPAHYRDVIEQYFRKLASEGSE